MDYMLRKNQILTPFGPGAIIEFDANSFMVKTVDEWDTSFSEQLDEPRLARQLRKNRFLTPRTDKEAGAFVKIRRFPSWHFCEKPSCRKMTKITQRDARKFCNVCNGKLVPVRFIMVCANGHADDVPWSRWAHMNQKTVCKDDKNLHMYTTSESGGLDSIVVKCATCNSSRNLSGISSPNIADLLNIKCLGKQPWEFIQAGTNPHPCQMKPQILQKGASNVHFPVIASSIDIPPHSLFTNRVSKINAIRGHKHYGTIRDICLAVGPDAMERMLQMDYIAGWINLIAGHNSITAEELRTLLLADFTHQPENAALIAPLIQNSNDFLFEEYRVFTSNIIMESHPEDFLIFHDMKSEINAYKASLSRSDGFLNQLITESQNIVSKIVMVEKLRIVRAFQGFYRMDSPNNTDGSLTFDVFGGGIASARMVDAANGNAGIDWLPAVENFGEGIFIQLNTNTISSWIENNPSILRRSKMIKQTPRYTVLHSLSHALIRQLTFECGYPAASLSERLYCSELSDNNMAGILIYTSTGDSYGSLGGLASQAKPERFFSVLLNSIRALEWCSNDPLCMESNGQGLDNLNLAACHSCLLLPETSCINFNKSLDRTLIIGNDNLNGLFKSVITI